MQVKEALQVTNLSVHYPGRIALDNVTLGIESSSVVAILGSIGSGKSTFVKACLGLAPIHRGTVSIFGTEFSHFKDRDRLGYVPQRIHDAMGIPATQNVFAEALKHLVQGGTTVVLVSHELGPLRPLIDRVIMFREGRVSFDGSPDAEAVDSHIFHDHPHSSSKPAEGWEIS